MLCRSNSRIRQIPIGSAQVVHGTQYWDKRAGFPTNPELSNRTFSWPKERQPVLQSCQIGELQPVLLLLKLMGRRVCCYLGC